jgi:hypothetical protein
VGQEDFLTINNLIMNKVYNFLALMFLVACISGCTRELTSEGVSKLTYYVTFQLTNGSFVISPKGTPFADPGYKAMEGPTDVTSKVSVEGTVNANAVGYYVLTYNATNNDGYSSSVSRVVIVYDPAAPSTDISGNYLSNVTRISPARAFTGLSVTITRVAPGVFYVSDLLGGFYDQGSNYMFGPTAAMNGYLQLNADNTLTYLTSYSTGFGDSLNSLTNAVFNPVTKGITWKANYTTSNYNYVITLTLI